MGLSNGTLRRSTLGSLQLTVANHFDLILITSCRTRLLQPSSVLQKCDRPTAYFEFRSIRVTLTFEACRVTGTQGVTVKTTGCGVDPHSRKLNIYLQLYFHFFALVSRQSAALSFAFQYATPPELGGKWGTECLNMY